MQQTTGTAVSKSTSSGGGVVQHRELNASRSENTVTVLNLGGGDADSSDKDVQLLQLYNNLWYGQMFTLPNLKDRLVGDNRASSSSTPHTPPRPILCRLPISSPLSFGKSAILSSISTTHGKHVSSTSDTRLFSPLFTSTPTKVRPTNQSPGLPDLSPSRYVLDATTSRATSTTPSEERHFLFTTSTHLAVPLYGPHRGLASTPTGRHPTVLSPPSYVGKALTHAAERVFTTIASHSSPKASCTTPRITGPTALSSNSSTVENEGKLRDSNLKGKEMVQLPRCPVGPRRCLAKEFGQEQHGTQGAKDHGKDDSSVLPDTPRTTSFPWHRDSCPSPIDEAGPPSVPVVTSVRPSPVFVTSPCLPRRKPNSAPAIPAYLTKSPEGKPHMPSPVYLLSHKQCSAQHPRLLQSCTKPIPGVKPSVRMRATIPQQESTVYTVQLIPRSNQLQPLAYLSSALGTLRVGKTGVTPKLQPHSANKATVLLSPTGPNQKPCTGGTSPQYITPGSQCTTDNICNPMEIQSSDFDPSVFLVALPATEGGVWRKEKPGSSISKAPSPSHAQHPATKEHCLNVPSYVLSKDYDNMSSYGRKCRGATQIYGFSLAPIPQPAGYHVICPHCGRDLSAGERLETTPAADPVSWYDRNCYICQQNPYKARCYK